MLIFLLASPLHETRYTNRRSYLSFIVTLGVCVSVCLSAEPRLHAALVSAAKVMRCIQFSLVCLCVSFIFFFSLFQLYCIVNKVFNIFISLRWNYFFVNHIGLTVHTLAVLCRMTFELSPANPFARWKQRRSAGREMCTGGRRDHVDGLDRRPRASSDGVGAALADLSDTPRN